MIEYLHVSGQVRIDCRVKEDEFDFVPLRNCPLHELEDRVMKHAEEHFGWKDGVSLAAQLDADYHENMKADAQRKEEEL